MSEAYRTVPWRALNAEIAGGVSETLSMTARAVITCYAYSFFGSPGAEAAIVLNGKSWGELVIPSTSVSGVISDTVTIWLPLVSGDSLEVVNTSGSDLAIMMAGFWWSPE